MCKFVTIFISDAKGLRQSWRNTHMIQFKVMNSGGAYIIKLGIHAGMLLAGILLLCCCAGCGSRDKMREEDSLQVLLTEEEDFSGHEDSGQTQDGLSGDNSEEVPRMPTFLSFLLPIRRFFPFGSISYNIGCS